MLHQQRERFFGLYPATFTPFDSKNRVKVEEIDAYAAFLAKEGVHAGAFISGTSGESRYTILYIYNIFARYEFDCWRAQGHRIPVGHILCQV